MLVQKEIKAVYLGTTKVRPSVKPITTAGIYRNETEGLISLSSDGSNWYTIMDKNLGATTVFNQGDTLTDANCGKLYQWGNNYGFAHSGSVTTSSTMVNTSTYGPGNYYNSSTFITGNYNWSSSQDNNLWGATTGTNEAMQGPSPSGYHVPTNDEWGALCGILTSTFGMAQNSTTMGTYLKMPMTGYRSYTNSNIYDAGSYGDYWSSTPYNNGLDAYRLAIRLSNLNPQSPDRRAYGYSVRPFKNKAAQPTEERTVLYQ